MNFFYSNRQTVMSSALGFIGVVPLVELSRFCARIGDFASVVVVLCNRDARSFIGSFIDSEYIDQYDMPGLNTIVRERRGMETAVEAAGAAIAGVTGLLIGDLSQQNTQVAVYHEVRAQGVYFVIGMTNYDWSRYFDANRRFSEARISRLFKEVLVTLAFNYEALANDANNTKVLSYVCVFDVVAEEEWDKFLAVSKNRTRHNQCRLVYELIRRTVAFGFLKVV